jgi:hypothetical protein
MRTDISTKVSLTIAAAFLVLTVAVLAIVASGSLGFAKQQARPSRNPACGWRGTSSACGASLSAARATNCWSAIMC